MKRIKKSHIFNIVLLGFAVLMLVSPGTKAWVSRGLMKVGLFKPNLETPANSKEHSGARTHTAYMQQGSLSFLDSEGNRYDAASLAGKVVFINFWATWCPPCIAEMPSINQLYQQFKDHEQVLFLIVDVDNEMEKSVQFMNDKKLGLPVHVAQGEIPTAWLGRSIPTTVILDKKGEIAARHEGMADYGRKEVVEFMNELISE